MSELFNTIVPISQWIILVTAILVMVGGLIGYLKASSMASLIAGGVSGLLTLAAFGLTFIDMKIGMIAACVIMIALQAVFAIRLKKSKKFMPAGVMLIVCGFTEVLLILSLIKLFGLV